jgi:hypothetical protein
VVKSLGELGAFRLDLISALNPYERTRSPVGDRGPRLMPKPTAPPPASDAISLVSDVAPVRSHLPGVSVFLCHASEDKLAVKRLDRRLRDDGVTTWLDEREILPDRIGIRQFVWPCEASPSSWSACQTPP